MFSPTRFFSRYLTPSESQYAELFVSALKSMGDMRSWQYDATLSRLFVPPKNGESVADVINLRNIYHEYKSSARKVRQEALRRQAAAMMQRYVPDSLDDARAHLLPVIRSSVERGQLYLSLDDDAKRDIAFRPLYDDLEIGIAFDSEYAISRLTESKLLQWGISFDEAYDIALDNLRRQSAKSFVQLQNGVLVSDFGDHYDASRILLTDLLYRQDLAGDPVVMAPNRAVLLVTGDRNVEGLAAMVSMAESAIQQPRRLSPLMLKCSGQRWEKFVPPSVAKQLTMLEVQDRMSDYETQKSMLDQHFQRRQMDIFVAKYSAFSRADGVVHSMCAWTEGVRALLPVTDKIFLFRPATNQHVHVPWARVVETCGHLMKRTDHLPARFEVDVFPEPSVFEGWLAEFG